MKSVIDIINQHKQSVALLLTSDDQLEREVGKQIATIDIEVADNLKQLSNPTIVYLILNEIKDYVNQYDEIESYMLFDERYPTVRLKKGNIANNRFKKLEDAIRQILNDFVFDNVIEKFDIVSICRIIHIRIFDSTNRFCQIEVYTREE
jgi:hypothetical protein